MSVYGCTCLFKWQFLVLLESAEGRSALVPVVRKSHGALLLFPTRPAKDLVRGAHNHEHAREYLRVSPPLFFFLLCIAVIIVTAPVGQISNVYTVVADRCTT